MIDTETVTSGAKDDYNATAYIERLTRLARAVRAAGQHSQELVFIQGSSESQFRGFIETLDSIGGARSRRRSCSRTAWTSTAVSTCSGCAVTRRAGPDTGIVPFIRRHVPL